MKRLALLVLLLGLVAAAVGLGLQVREQDSLEQAERDALRAAQEATQAVLAYDHRTVADDIAAAQRYATGRFLDEYVASTADLAEQAVAGEAVVTAQVHAASVVQSSGERVVVLLFADQTTTRKDRPDPRIDQSRLRLVLVPVEGRWRVAELESL